MSKIEQGHDENCPQSEDEHTSQGHPSRRTFLKLSASSGVALAGGMALAGIPLTPVKADDFHPLDEDDSVFRRYRGREAFSRRADAARYQFFQYLNMGTQFDNDDEQRYAGENYYASFTKTLPSNEFGEVEPFAFEQLVEAMRNGEMESFDAIPLDASAARTLANPQGAFKYDMEGIDSHGTRMNPSHTFRSAEIAGEEAEVYWQALARDVPFINYDDDPLTNAAVADLSQFSAPPAAAAHNGVSTGTLFRGETPGDLVGPYISQFLWHDVTFGPVEFTQRYQAPMAGVNFMQDADNWLNIQRGGAPNEMMSFDETPRYIFNNRTLGEYVHRDVSFQAYLHAALVLLGYGSGAWDSGNPYRSAIANQGAFTSLGPPFVLDMVTKAANLALQAAWFQKWRVHRFLRPEAMGGRIHFHMTGQRQYELHDDILNSDALARVASMNGNYFLPMAFTEGSPTHPSYPAGHACIAGACVTVLKGFFDENFVIPNPVQADATGENLLDYTGGDLTVGDELNKLANNISLGRDAAGVHYRQDGVQGLYAGEWIGMTLLQDQSRCFNESNFDGFNLTRFDGSTVSIDAGRIFPNPQN